MTNILVKIYNPSVFVQNMSRSVQKEEIIYNSDLLSQ